MTENLDVAVVGGGPAGLSAALVLGRMRRRVLLLDTEAPANAVSDAMHGFLSRDGTPPAEVRRIAAEQLAPYETVERRVVAATSARRSDDGFAVGLADGTEVSARRLLLAHGMRYERPELEGVEELWGRSIFHCPYCHGWEVRDQPIAVYGCVAKSVHVALMLRSLTDQIALVTDACAHEVPAEQMARLEAAGIELLDDPVRRVAEEGEGLRVEFASERDPLPRHALFVPTRLVLASDLAGSLGAELSDHGAVATDPAGLSSVPGLYVAGDASAPVQSVAVANASGARAAYAINTELAMM